eukprot:5760351-Amphidinium_carterae.1
MLRGKDDGRRSLALADVFAGLATVKMLCGQHAVTETLDVSQLTLAFSHSTLVDGRCQRGACTHP